MRRHGSVMLCITSAILVLPILIPRLSMSQEPNRWDIPGDFYYLSDALESEDVEDGDTLYFSQNYNDVSFVLDRPLVLLADTVTVTITADDATAMTVGADGAVVDGLTFKTGTYGSPVGIVVISGASEVRNCTMLDDGHSGNVYGVDVYNGATLRNCTVTLTSGDGRAVAINSKPGGGYAQILHNTLNVELDSGATQLTGVQYLDGRRAVIDGNVITFTGDEAASGIGVWIDTDNDSTTVTHNSILGAGDKGVESWADDVTLEDNLVEGFTYGLYLY
jgi:nitrous oxidase accessory protein NosD